MRLHEIFDHDIDVEWEPHGGGFEIAAFGTEGKTYVVQIHKIPGLVIDEQLKGKKVGEVSFFRAEKSGDAAFSSTHDVDAQTKVYGAVMNALIKKFADFDAFVFSIEKRHSEGEEFKQKREIYDFLAHHAKTKTGAIKYKKNTATAALTILSKTELEEKDGLINEQAEMVRLVMSMPIPVLKRGSKN